MIQAPIALHVPWEAGEDVVSNKTGPRPISSAGPSQTACCGTELLTPRCRKLPYDTIE